MKNLTNFLFVFVVYCFAHASCAQQGFILPSDSNRVEIPVEIHNNLIVLPVTVNNQVTLKFILDSNVEYPILTEKAIGDQLGLEYQRKIPLNKTPEGTNYGLTVSGVQLILPSGVKTGENHSMLVLENDFMNLVNIARAPVHGLIGYDLFGYQIVEIDYSKKMLILHNRDGFKPAKSFSQVPISLNARKAFLNSEIVFENWDRLPKTLQIKTGAIHTLLFSDDSAFFHLPAHNLEIPLGMGPEGRIEGHIGRVRELNISKYKLENPLASFTKDGYSQSSSIGMGILSRFDLIFDYQKQLLYLRRGKTFSNSFEYDMSGLMIEAAARNTYIVTHVQEDCPAEKASVQVGDQVLSINGQSLTEENLDELLTLFSKKPDKTVRMKLLKGNREVEVSFELRRMI